VQGRQGGFDKLLMKDAAGLRTEGHAETEKFKTGYKYGYQILIINHPITQSLFNNYLDHIRPIIQSIEVTLPSDSLFLTIQSTPLTGIGRKVTQFFKECSPLNMSSNNIRSTLSSLVKVLENEELITTNQRESFCNLSGHSIATSDKSYAKLNLRNERLIDMQVATKALQAGRSYGSERYPSNMQRSYPSNMQRSSSISSPAFSESSEEYPSNMQRSYPSNMQRSSSISSPAFSESSEEYPSNMQRSSSISSPAFSESSERYPSNMQRNSNSYTDWGSEHPEGDDPLKARAIWSDRELLYVYNFSINSRKKRTSAECLLEICNDPETRKIFHPNHVMDKTRLAYAFAEIKKNGVVQHLLKVLKKWSSPAST
jgi:hypothetical protein